MKTRPEKKEILGARHAFEIRDTNQLFTR